MTVVQQNEANLPPTATSMTVTITSELPAAEAGEPTHITDAPEPTKIIDGSESNDHGHHDTNPDDKGSEEYDDSQSSSDHEDNNKGSFPEPKLRLEIRDLGHPGAVKFLGAVNAGTVLSDAVKNVQRLLYRLPSDPHTNMPPTRSVTVILRDMGGVAYTTGTDLDRDHKEIHFSLSYINSIKEDRLTSEITGVLTHELVHCYQWDARGTCPGGLIEGIADWVRLRCDLGPPHWRHDTKGEWDRGYQQTAYFLDYIESRYGEGTVRRINEKLRLHKYKAKPFWTELVGRPVEQLWGDYCDHINEEEPGKSSEDGDKNTDGCADK